MNNLLRNLVVEEKMAVFIDDVMVVMEIEEVLWQPLVTKTNDYTSSKSLNIDIK